MENLKTLVILTGQFRGGKETWKTLYKNLVIPYNADLALCFSKKEEENIKENYLTEKSKYIWTIKKYDDWTNYYRENFNGFWKHNLSYGLIGGGGTHGVVTPIFKHYIYANYSKILKKYDRIIITRSDMYFIHRHPILSNNHVWIMEGEDYGGYLDTFMIFPTKYMKECLNIVEYVDSEELKNLLSKMYSKTGNLSFIENGFPLEKGLFNSECYHRLYFESTGIVYKIRRSPCVQFLVLEEGKDTVLSNPTWKNKALRFKNNLFIRDKNSAINAFRTVLLFKIPEYID
jgi:hypothetical protein